MKKVERDKNVELKENVRTTSKFQENGCPYNLLSNNHLNSIRKDLKLLPLEKSVAKCESSSVIHFVIVYS